MKEKILAAIKLKFPNVKLTQKRLDALAAKIEAKVKDDETKIDAALDALNEIYPIEDIAKDDHAHNTTEGRLKAAQKKIEEKEKTTETDDDPAPDPDTPKWAKSLIDQNKKLADDLASLKGEKVAADIKTKAADQLKQVGVPTSFWEGRALPEKEDALEDFVTKTTAAYDAHLQELKNQGLSVTRKPITANGGKEKETIEEKTATQDEVNKVLEAII
jgi:hypothetical protein